MADAPDPPIPGNREDALTGWLRERLGEANLLGDDGAVLPELPAGSRLVATVDSQIAGVHYPEWLPVEIAARRLLAVNLSDLAAMGAEPRWALLALSGPVGLDRRAYFEGLVEACEEWGVVLAGGDLARTSGTVIGSLTLLGELPAGRQPLRRDRAEVGQEVWVSGSLGESAAGRLLLQRGATVKPAQGAEAGATGYGIGHGAGGFRRRWQVGLPPDLPLDLAATARRAVWRHLDPTPEITLGRALASSHLVGAVMDLSDGLATDLPRLCRASGTGAEIDAATLPTPSLFGDLCGWLGEDATHLALGGGEDYALLVTLPPGAPVSSSVTRIGRMREHPAVQLRTDRGTHSMPEGGWDHLSGQLRACE